MGRAGAAIPGLPGPAHAPDPRGSCRASTDAVRKDATADCDRSRSVSFGPMPDGREGVRSLTRPMRVPSTAGPGCERKGRSLPKPGLCHPVFGKDNRAPDCRLPVALMYSRRGRIFTEYE